MNPSEELCYLVVHGLIDDIFPSFQPEPEIAPEVIPDKEEIDREILPPIPKSPPKLIPVRVAIGGGIRIPIPAKRRRLGVNSGAHDQIVNLQGTLRYVTEEREFYREKCLELEQKLKRISKEKSSLENDLDQMANQIRQNKRKIPEKKPEITANEP